MKLKSSLKFQSGVASLLTAIVLLTCITLIVLFTSNTVVTDTKMTSDNTRSMQAEQAALAAMTYAVSYFTKGGLDQNDDCTPDDGNIDLGSTGTVARGRGTYKFIATKYWNGDMNNPVGSTTSGSPNICGCNPPKGRPCAMLWAKGWSDDNLATRTMTQCVNTKPLFEPSDGNGPPVGFFSASNVVVSGNASFINRYTNTNIWTGGSYNSGGSINTYLRADGETVTDLMALCDGTTCTDENGYTDPYKYLNSENPEEHARPVTTGQAGDGVDIIRDDPNLKRTPDEIFKMFFGTNSRTDVENSAIDNGQHFTSTNGTPPLFNDDRIAAGLDPLSGLVWYEGDFDIKAGEKLGKPGKPVVLVVHGELNMNGGTIYGAVYTTGIPRVPGQTVLKGSLISEVIPTTNVTPGTGRAKIIYVPFGQSGKCGADSGLTNTIGTKAVIAGSWKNW